MSSTADACAHARIFRRLANRGLKCARAQERGGVRVRAGRAGGGGGGRSAESDGEREGVCACVRACVLLWWWCARARARVRVSLCVRGTRRERGRQRRFRAWIGWAIRSGKYGGQQMGPAHNAWVRRDASDCCKLPENPAVCDAPSQRPHYHCKHEDQCKERHGRPEWSQVPAGQRSVHSRNPRGRRVKRG
jgi:hypothetical protein